MTTVRPLPRLNVIRKWTRRRLVTHRPCRKVAVVAATDVIADVTQQSTDGSVETGFCGEPFADVDRTYHMEESIRMAENTNKWIKYVHGVANPRIEDG